MNIVLDTNILISYGLGNENARRIIDYVKLNKVDVYADHRLLDEYKRIPNRKKFDFTSDIMSLLDSFVNDYVTIVRPIESTIKFNPDRQDSKLIEIANFSSSDYLITDDKQLLRNANHLTKSHIISSIDFCKKIDCLQ